MKIVKIINLRTVVICITVALFVVIIVMGQRLNREIDLVTKKPSYKKKDQIGQHVPEDDSEQHGKTSDIKDDLISQEKIVRKTRRDPRGGTYLESTFFRGKEVVARYKELKGEIYDMEGSIPDGKVEFLNEITKVKGEEFYQKGKRHGLYKEYYKTGQLKKEAQFTRGRVMSSKEYYLNGLVRLEQEFKNILWDIFDADNVRQGSGRLYYPEGTVEREWDYEGEAGERYLRIYDKNGVLKSVEYYDEEGNPVKN